MTRLLLFTNDYPYATGDAVFVRNEIDDLAARFDDVVVFCHARDTAVDLLPMPPNVKLGGNLFQPAPEDSPWTPLRPRMLAGLASAAWRELCAGRLRGHARLFLMGARVGMTQAHRVAVRHAAAEAQDVVAYAFWGMGCGLGLPWLSGVRARVVRVHRYDLYESRAEGGYLPARSFLYARADRVLTISEDGGRYLAQRPYADAVRGKVILSRLGVPGPATVDREGGGEGLLVVSCSAVTEHKRVALILAAVRLLAMQSGGHPVRWVHFGDGPLLDQLREAARDVPEHLTVELRGRTPNDQVTAFYRQHRVDVFVNASTTEGVPVSIMEAIAHGIPVVATSVGGTPEIVGEALRSGELVSVDASPEELAAAVRTVADAADGAYAPRELWAREYDVRITGPRAAELVAGAPTVRRRR
ncbi:glycosyltransferase [Microbacterium sp. ET2]|uniref:glycosyltransferase n=1 Tax=Microbacterium albipurpureum TaxID=3050384 RepID=UPI00259CECB1|nr:glycosyltransferase [Microbacterium sp. ET2 (Ac-2212)]WJL95092.1 glycosyltransferase [Microbacterium sp. ET2 (Ac-2212)]